MDTRTCCACKKRKRLLEFSKKTANTKSAMCRICKRKYNASWYRRNKTSHVANVAKNNNKYRKELASFLAKIKDKPCTDCKKKYPTECMDFDHIDPSNKIDCVARMRMTLSSKSRIMTEIKKCELVCANCHRIRTKKRFRSSIG